MRLSDTVEPCDVTEAIRLMNVATQRAAVDPRTGTIDMSLIASGQSGLQAEAVVMLAEDLREVIEDMAASIGSSSGGGAGSARKAGRVVPLAELVRKIDAATAAQGGGQNQTMPALLLEAARLLMREDVPLFELLGNDRLRILPRAGRGIARGAATAPADDGAPGEDEFQ